MTFVEIWQQAAAVIAHPALTIVLLLVGLGFLVAEMITHQAWGWEGTVGALLVGLVFAAEITDYSAAYGITGGLLFALGILLFIVETHVLPGRGIGFFSGVLFLWLGLFYALGGPAKPLFSALGASGLTVASLVTFFVYIGRFGHDTWERMLREAANGAGPLCLDPERLAELVGHGGKALTALRPVGTVEVAGYRLPALTEGEFIGPQRPVEVVRIEGDRVVVLPK